uniref:C2H2-type domain-containing protein n=1 Tax=Leptobrachium leishanense TaxID=445787 RepID=A0A8C5Q5F5_9ANUR
MYKDNARDPLSQRILDLTLEIIFLLTGEGHMVVKIHEMVSDSSCHQISEGGYCRTQSFNTEPSPHSGIHEQNNEKILELTKKIIRLLTGEVPIRCEDVTVYLSMEEWEYVERHKDLYKVVTMEDHQPIVTLDKSASGDFGAESITSNMEQYLNKETGSATNTEQETCEKRNVPEKDLNPVAEHTEYPTTDIKEEPDSCEEEKKMYRVIYNPTEYTMRKYTFTHTEAELASCEEDLSDSDLYPPPEHPQIEYSSTGFKTESPTYDGNLTEKELYKPAEHTQTEWVHEKLDKYLKGYSNLMKINPRESLIGSQKPDQSIYYTDTLNSVHKGNTELSSQMDKVSYSETAICSMHHKVREPLSSSACVDNSTIDSAFKHQHVNTVEQPSSCPECGKHFTDLIALKKHQTVHTGKTHENTNPEQETCEKRNVPEKDLNPVAEHTEYSTTDIKEEPDSCEEENQMYSVIYNPTEYTETKYNSTFSEAESASCEEDISDPEIYPPPEHPQIEYSSTGFKTESPTYDGNLTEKEFYKPAEHTQTEWVHEKLDKYLKGYSTVMKINRRRSLIESQKPDQSIYYTDTVMLNSVHKGNPAFSSQKNKVSYSETDFVNHGTNVREEPFSSSACGDNSIIDSAFKPQHINTVETLSCPEYGKPFTDLIALKKHQKIHTGKTQFKHPEYRNYYTDPSHFAAHAKTHTGEKPFKCAVCGKCFVYASRLTQHNRIHTGEKPFKCQECGKCFTNSSHLKTHKMIHTGEKSFKCGDCGKCFTFASHLTDHKRIHTGERPYKCSECEKCFTQASHLATHKMIHTGEKTFKCGDCGKCFTFASHLTEHKRVHTGERPFKCSECEKCFTQASSLARHKMIHKGEKLFKCAECGKCFTWAFSLARHEMIHTQ